ncbi:MAG: hypothetical protein JWN64_742 [Parcubacteria group bacterium]|nr:hypothetical protein [Parcubacteria group bacterium]
MEKLQSIEHLEEGFFSSVRKAVPACQRKNVQVRGFTLVELLVVIAIIGLLSGIILASLNYARSQSRDAAIKTQMAAMRNQAEIFSAANGSYTGLGAGGGEDNVDQCLSKTNPSFAALFINTVLDPDVTGNINALGVGVVHNRGAANGSRVFCGVSSARWAFAVPLNSPTSSGANGWCVDSTGASKAVTLDFNAANTSFYTCP